MDDAIMPGNTTGQLLSAVRTLQHQCNPPMSHAEYVPWKFSSGRTVIAFPTIICPLCTDVINGQVIYLYTGTTGLITMRYPLGTSSRYMEEHIQYDRSIRVHPHISDRGRLCWGEAETAAEALTNPNPANAYVQPGGDPTTYDKFLLMDFGHNCGSVRQIFLENINSTFPPQVEASMLIDIDEDRRRNYNPLDYLVRFTGLNYILPHVLQRNLWVDCFSHDTHIEARENHSWKNGIIGSSLNQPQEKEEVKSL